MYLVTNWFPLPLTSLGYTLLSFFANWIVGFTIAEGHLKASGEYCFSIKQRSHDLLFEALCLVFGTSRKVTMEQGKYMQLSLSSKNSGRLLQSQWTLPSTGSEGYSVQQMACWGF